jgi:RNA polymerase sigma-70 factor
VALHQPPEGDAGAWLATLVAEDVFLACACLRDLPGAVAAFDTAYLTRVPAFVAHIDSSPAFADEIRQVLRERLLVRSAERQPRIADYSGRGALMTWLRITAVRIALNHRLQPQEARRVDDEQVLDELATQATPELQVLRARHADLLARALKDAVAALPPEQRVILRMYFSSGQNTERIAVAMRVNRSTAARRLVAARQAVFSETKRLLRAHLSIDSEEFASIARNLHSQLDISITSLLAEK